MPVSARSANLPPSAATPPLVDMRGVEGGGPTPVLAGTFPFDVGDDTLSGWHSHDLHQLAYAFQGVMEIETRTAHYLLPPQQALWIPAGLEHCTTLSRVKTVAVFFDPRLIAEYGDRARVLAAAPVIREMIVYAARWRIDRPSSDATADTYFEALARLVAGWLEDETPLCLPTSTDPLVSAVMDYTRANLASATVHDVCRAVGTSERSLRRNFLAATGMTWRRYLQESRLLRAMALLAEPGTSVTAVAATVGFQSVDAFNRAFKSYAGQTPSSYRRRAHRGG